MKEKPILYLDFDNTITDATKRFCETYSLITGKDVNYEEVTGYDFQPVIKDLTRNAIKSIFESKLYFEGLEFYDGCKEMLEHLQSLYSLVFVTIGTPLNLYYKTQFLLDKAPNLYVAPNKFLGIDNFYHHTTKKDINMENSVFIDDHIENLETSNAKYKILFRDNPKHTWSVIPKNSKLKVYSERERWDFQLYDDLRTIHRLKLWEE